MIRGYCIGGGLGLAVCCDLRIAPTIRASPFRPPSSASATAFRASSGSSDLVGPSFAKEIFFTARQFDAAEAQTMGLVNRVVPADKLEAYVKDYADTIGGNAPLTVNAVKFIANETVRGRVASATSIAAPTMVEAVLRQQGLHRGPPRLHGEAQAGVHRRVTPKSLSRTRSGPSAGFRDRAHENRPAASWDATVARGVGILAAKDRRAGMDSARSEFVDGLLGTSCAGIRRSSVRGIRWRQSNCAV